MADNIKEKIEDKVIDTINSGVAGRLIIFKPEDGLFGADLAVERKGKYKAEKIYFKIESLVIPAKTENFIKDFIQEDFKSGKNFYLMFVCFDEVAQKISDQVWIIPSLQFRDNAQVVESDEGKKLLRFDAPLDVKQKNQYSKFLINSKELGKITLDALQKGGIFSFKEIIEKEAVNLESLKKFLCDARKNTYASDATPVDNPRLLESKQLEFQKGDYFYRDIFFDENKKFIGQEIIYKDSKPIWGMNYMGDQIGKLETSFLRESLFELVEKCRIGGVCEYEKRELKYEDRGKGSLDEFSGEEHIFMNGKKIYKLNYQGGLL